MKLFLAASLPVIAAAISDGDSNTYTCRETAPCLSYTVVQNASPACSGDHSDSCDYTVCWTQDNSQAGCDLSSGESFSHIGDMSKTDLCLNDLGKKGYWDDGCNDSLGGEFGTVCQVIKPGGWAHFLTKKGQTCVPSDGSDETATLSDSSGAGTSAFCAPTTDDATLYPDSKDGGQTYFPATSGNGGTCSGNAMGVECVFSVQVPSTCGPAPTNAPVVSPTNAPVVSPTNAPVVSPTNAPVVSPTNAPVVSPTNAPVVAPTDGPFEEAGEPPAGSNGDPHFKTWKNEHFEYHGQCDMVLVKDAGFADGLGLDVQIRTKLIRFWSYIKSAAIKIGDDILEVEGSPRKDDADDHSHYWINLEYRGKLETVGGFPVTKLCPATYKCQYEIDLSSKYPGQKIVIGFFKEFVKVDFQNGAADAFGNVVGMLGDFNTGKTLSRDGVTEIHDFTKLGNEWQVLPVEHMLFHDVSEPQFPKKCIEPEDPQGQRRRRLGEASVTEEQAEAACARLKDPMDRKDCVYDILATQDVNMVGAY